MKLKIYYILVNINANINELGHVKYEKKTENYTFYFEKNFVQWQIILRSKSLIWNHIVVMQNLRGNSLLWHCLFQMLSFDSHGEKYTLSKYEVAVYLLYLCLRSLITLVHSSPIPFHTTRSPPVGVIISQQWTVCFSPQLYKSKALNQNNWRAV